MRPRGLRGADALNPPDSQLLWFVEEYPTLFEELVLTRLDATVGRCRLTVSKPVLKLERACGFTDGA